jgi:hypothetical protein
MHRRPAAVTPEPISSEPIASDPVASEAIAAEPVASEGSTSKRSAFMNWASLLADGPLHKIGDCLLEKGKIWGSCYYYNDLSLSF